VSTLSDGENYAGVRFGRLIGKASIIVVRMIVSFEVTDRMSRLRG
jgi:hypothetical protein